MKAVSYILFFILTLHSISVIGQRDTINQVNSKGKKIGYWKVFLDEKCDPTDSAYAFFYGYELYDNGKHVWKFFKHEKSQEEGVLTYQGKLPEKGKPELLSGTFKSYFSYGLWACEEVYKNGAPLYVNSILRDKKNPETHTFRQVFYFDKLYNNIPGTYYYEEITNDHLTKYWYYKGKAGWKCYKIK